MRFLFLFSFFTCFIFAFYSIESIEEKPKGVARDFYIYEYLIKNKNINKEDSLKLYSLIHNKNQKILSLLNIDESKMPKNLLCAKLPYAKLIASDDECLNMGFKLSFALDNKISKKIKNRIKNQKMLEGIKILESKNILDSILDSNGEQFAFMYDALPRAAIFNKSFKKSLSSKNYSKAIYKIVLSKKYPKFTESLLKKNITDVNDYTFLALGLNELMQGRKDKALKYFASLVDVTKDSFLRDKGNFWQYKISGDNAYLRELANSSNFNIYSLYANKKLNLPSKYDVTDINDSIFKDLKNTKAPFNIQNPFEWQILLENIRLVKDKPALLNTAKMFAYESSLPHFIFVLNRYFNYSKNFFVVPYKQYFDEFASLDTIRFLAYSIARQESHFIPTAISYSYALGIMQIIPSNISHLAKELELENINFESMFDPSTSIQFGVHYIKYLHNRFPNPLFVAYAYNAGPTFLNNYLSNHKNAFNKSNKYDPWLSMELIPYEQSRNYGLNVVANYVVFNELNGKNIDIDALLESTLR